MCDIIFIGSKIISEYSCNYTIRLHPFEVTYNISFKELELSNFKLDEEVDDIPGVILKGLNQTIITQRMMKDLAYEYINKYPNHLTSNRLIKCLNLYIKEDKYPKRIEE